MSSDLPNSNITTRSQLTYLIPTELYHTLTSPKYLRSNLNIYERVGYLSSLSLVWGLLLGGYQSGKLAKLKYLASNQHQLPKGVEGWYFFHKLKNYKVLLASIQGGLKTSSKLVGLGLVYEGIQDSLDVTVFDKTSWKSSTVAGCITSVGFSYLVGLPIRSRRLAILAGTGLATLTGILQEYLLLKIKK